MKIPFHGNAYAANGNACILTDRTKAVQLPCIRTAYADIHPILFVRRYNGVIGHFIPEAVGHLFGCHIRQLFPFGIGQLQHPGRTHAHRQHQMCLPSFPFPGKLF